MELLTNAAQTHLDGAINNSVTSITVLVATSFPSTGNFRILIDSEIMLVTAVSGLVFTVVRGIEGTTAVVHADGSAIIGILTKGSINQYHLERHLTYPITLPINGDFAWINQGGASVTVNDYIYLNAPGPGSINLRIRKKAAPTAPYKIDALLLPIGIPSGSTWSVGLCFRESSSSKLHTLTVGGGSATAYIASEKWTNETTFSANYISYDLRLTYQPIRFFRIEDDNTNRKCSISNDGRNFILLHSIGRTDFITANEVGFFVRNDDATFATGLTLASWIEG